MRCPSPFAWHSTQLTSVTAVEDMAVRAVRLASCSCAWCTSAYLTKSGRSCDLCSSQSAPIHGVYMVGVLPVHNTWANAGTHVACHMLYTVCLLLGCVPLLAFLHLACLAICLAASCALAFMCAPNAHLHPARSRPAVLARRVHPSSFPPLGRSAQRTSIFLTRTRRSVPTAAIRAPPPACACLRSSRTNPSTPAVRAHAHTVGHSLSLSIRLPCADSVGSHALWLQGHVSLLFPNTKSGGQHNLISAHGTVCLFACRVPAVPCSIRSRRYRCRRCPVGAILRADGRLRCHCGSHWQSSRRFLRHRRHGASPLVSAPHSRSAHPSLPAFLRFGPTPHSGPDETYERDAHLSRVVGSRALSTCAHARM